MSDVLKQATLLVALMVTPGIALSTTIFSEDFNSFRGNGFAPSPAAGQLDSDSWWVTGLSAGDGVLGGLYTDPLQDFARGTSTGFVSTGGIYAFETSGGDFSLGAQPSSSDLTPGAINLRIQNTSGMAIASATVQFDWYYLNNEDREVEVRFTYSEGNSTSDPLWIFNTPETSDVSPTWVRISLLTLIDFDDLVPASSFFDLHWFLDDGLGAGPRDEIGLDNVVVNVSPPAAIPVPASAWLFGTALIALFARGRKKLTRKM